MSAVRGKVLNGAIVVDRPVDWPDGTEVVVHAAEDEVDWGGMREEDWPTTPEGIEALMKRWDAIEPLVFTPSEEADIAAWRKKVKEYTAAKSDERIREMFP